MSLLVDPAVLNHGAGELRRLQTELTDVIATIGIEHARLKDVWTGAAADHVNAIWDELRPRISTHIEKLGQQATSLTTVATQITGQDTQNSSGISAAASSLDLP